MNNCEDHKDCVHTVIELQLSVNTHKEKINAIEEQMKENIATIKELSANSIRMKIYVGTFLTLWSFISPIVAAIIINWISK
jgi:2C-methyl-D-erythritol 2,4-cyclodiphosphate synthase